MRRRILVLGSPGAGKTRLAHDLASRTGLPLVHLDDLYWGPGWSRPSDEEWRRRLTEACAHDAWIIDGNYAPSIDVRARRADAAVLLDVHPAVCVWRLAGRAARARGRGGAEHRPAGLDPSDPVSDDLLRLARKAAGFRRHQLPLIESSLRTHAVEVLAADELDTRSTAQAPAGGPPADLAVCTCNHDRTRP